MKGFQEEQDCAYQNRGLPLPQAFSRHTVDVLSLVRYVITCFWSLSW